MSFVATIIAVITTLIEVIAAQRNSSIVGLALQGSNTTKFEVLSLGTYQVLRAEIYLNTVNVSANLSVLTTREIFAVSVQGITDGALPVWCKASWLTLSVVYPAIVPFECADPAVNATLLQGEVWPEYGGFFLFVEFNGVKPAAWMVGNHLSSAADWSYEPTMNETWPPSGHWTWAGEQIIDSMPSVSLPKWLGFHLTDP